MPCTERPVHHSRRRLLARAARAASAAGFGAALATLGALPLAARAQFTEPSPWPSAPRGADPEAPVDLPPPERPRDMDELQLQFARRLVAASPGASYLHRAPDRLLAIPVLEVELHPDGRVRRISVLRRPTTGDEAIELAVAAILRAAPFGDVSHLPQPCKVVEMFLFDDDLRFKPRTLDDDE